MFAAAIDFETNDNRHWAFQPSPARNDSLQTGALLQRKPACPCGGGCPRCQSAAANPGLAISQPGDAFEREADAVAERVMGMDAEASGAGGGPGLPGRAEGPSLSSAGAPLLARQAGDTALASVASSDYQPASLDCDPFDDEGFPVLKRGNHRHAVGVAQINLNKILPQIVACLSDPACMAGYTPKAQNFMREQIGLLSKIPIDVDCQFGLDTLHATYAAQAYFFKQESEWDGIIGPRTWRATDNLAPEPSARPAPSDLLWDFVLPPAPPPKPIFL